MNISNEILIILENKLERKIVNALNLSGGKNSRVFRIDTDSDEYFVLKLYHKNKKDLRNRLETEYRSFQFLGKSGIDCVPKPIYINAINSFAVYEYISGDKIGRTFSKEDINQAISFLKVLHKISFLTKKEVFNRASEACFTGQEVINNINQRYIRLTKVKKSYPLLNIFLESEFLPELEKLTNDCKMQYAKNNVFWDVSLPQKERILSPSDFGFHNAIQRESGEWVFLDFEYFGWDDPAKLICDFMLHPAMNLSKELKEYYFLNMIRDFSDKQNFSNRVKTLYPLFCLKWCMIFLNEFLPEHFSRRKFALGGVYDNQINENQKEMLQQKQLEKAIKMLNHIKEENINFI